MRFLIDNALSPRVAEGLVRAREDALHVQELGLRDAEDEVIFARAEQDDRILVSADTDFGTLLALRKAQHPSVILFRHGATRSPELQVALLLAHLPDLRESLEAGCLVTFEASRIRLRTLPIA